MTTIYDAKNDCHRTVYATAEDAKQVIRDAINAGEASADDYDVDAIFDKAFAWHNEVGSDGNTYLNSSGYVETTADADEFWAIVAECEQ